MRSFVKFLYEAATHATTGHLEHAGDWLFGVKDQTSEQFNPLGAIDHIEKTHERFKGNPHPEHNLSLKVDGGMSIVVGRDHNGKHFVAYKTSADKVKFYNEKQIRQFSEQENKPYYNDLIHVLKRTKNMKNLQNGHAFQADLVHNNDSEEHTETVQPNAIKYRPPKGKKLMLATHSQYEVHPETGKLIKTSDRPDLSQLEEKHTHAPSLGVHEGVKLSMSDEGHEKMNYHLKQAKKYMDKDAIALVKSIHADARGEGSGVAHPHFHAFLKHYSNNMARTTGTRSVESLKKHADKIRDKELKDAQKEAVKKGKTFDPNSKKVQNINEKHRAFHDFIKKNQKSFNKVFQAHNHITHAKHTILDHFRDHEHQFDVQTHGGEEHEGLVSVTGGTMAKLVREGPGGFPEKNVANAAIRFGTKSEDEES